MCLPPLDVTALQPRLDEFGAPRILFYQLVSLVLIYLERLVQTGLNSIVQAAVDELAQGRALTHQPLK